jgi:iron(III) transport system substrate-binding protein
MVLNSSKNLSYSKFVFLLVISLILFSFANCKKDSRPSLLIYSPHGTELLEAMKTKFEEKNPGIEVRYLDLSSQEIYDRVKLEKSNVQADVWWGASAITFSKAAEEGLFEPYRPSWAEKVPENARDSKDLWYGTFQTPEVIVYNNVAIKADEIPKDWDDLLDPKWKGRLIVRDPVRSDTMRTIFGAMILRQWEPNQKPDLGYDWLRKLDTNTKEYTVDGTVLLQKLARQEGVVSLWDLPDVASAINRQKLPLGFSIPTSGTPLVIDGIAIIKNTPKLKLAQDFYEFVTTEENLLIAARDFYHPPLRTDIDKSKLPEWLSKIDIKPMPVNQELYKNNIQDWMRYWDSQIRNQNNR